MKDVTMFIMATCPYCRQAIEWMEELKKQHPEYTKVPVKMIDETKEPELAAQYDYYYVPTYYVGDRKVHEGAATKIKVQNVFLAALAAEEKK